MIASTQKNRLFFGRGWPCLFVLLLAFFTGAVSGFFVAFLGRENESLQIYLADLLGLAEHNVIGSSFLATAWNCVRWPLMVLIFSFHSLGTIAIPILFCVRGFLLSHAFLAISYALPDSGFYLYIFLFLVTILFIVPTLFLWGYEGLRSMASIRFSGSAQRFRIEVILIGIGALLVAIAVQWALIPFILNSFFV